MSKKFITKASSVKREVAHRAEFVRNTVEAFGPVTGTKIFRDQRSGNAQEEYKVEVGDLQHPFYVSGKGPDVSVFRDMRTNPLMKQVRDRLSTDMTAPVLDIGANIGCLTVMYASQLPQAPVFALEPLERNVQRLAKNTQAYGSRIQVLHGAVTSEPGFADIQNSGEKSAEDFVSLRFGSLGNDASANTGSDEQIRGYAPYELIHAMDYPKELSVLSIDIEGAEKDLFLDRRLNGLSELIGRTNLLVIGTHDRYVPGSYDAVIDGAKEAGLQLIDRNPIAGTAADYDLLFAR